MAKYVDLDSIVAEIERRLKNHKEEIGKYSPFQHNLVYDIIGKKEECNDILSFLNTLEVKEEDLDMEISQFIDANFKKATIGHKLSLKRIAKFFFELGLKTKRE